jgi:hypothetical protein
VEPRFVQTDKTSLPYLFSLQQHNEYFIEEILQTMPSKPLRVTLKEKKKEMQRQLCLKILYFQS